MASGSVIDCEYDCDSWVMKNVYIGSTYKFLFYNSVVFIEVHIQIHGM